MSYMRIITLPEIPKAKPTKRLEGHNRRYNNLGIFYVDGMGCAVHNNCFECPLSDCTFLNNKGTTDLQHLADKGDGVKPY
ncbi:hypothetical protein LCGC14_2755700 [marine sediment metagenome]|uniref:Uncharacterized protein n=1 Tax=marine sediment metagenome TaxID=412755 RepID=A0A0F9B920_9ZZZZ